MIRERRLAELAEKQRGMATPPTPALSNPAPDWHKDLQFVAQTIRAPYFDEDTILTRSRLIRAVKSAPHDVNAWRQLITQMDLDRKATSTSANGESADFDMHTSMVRLLETATRVIPRSSANRFSAVYLSIWLDLARVHEELPVDCYLARDVYKTLKGDRIGTTFQDFWNSYADFEERQGEIEKAKKLRSEIPRRCYVNKRSPMSATPTEDKSKAAGEQDKAKIDKPSDRTAQQQKDKEKENRVPDINSRLRSTPSQIPAPSRRNIQCTPPSQVLPDPKRMHVDSPESMRRHDKNIAIEEPDLLGNDMIASARPPQTQYSTHVTSAQPQAHPHLSSQSLQQPRNPAHATSWKLRAQQPLHSSNSTPIAQNSYADSRNANVTPNVSAHRANTGERLRMRHATPSQSHAEAEFRSASRRANPDLNQQERMETDRDRRYQRQQEAVHRNPGQSHRTPASVSAAVEEYDESPSLSPALAKPQMSGRRVVDSDSSSSRSGCKPIGRMHREDQYDAQQANYMLRNFFRNINQNDIIEVNGRQYLQLGIIGKGGSSKVFKVLSQKLVVMALKRVHVRKSSTNFKATFDSYANEINLLKRLRGKPNIVYCHDAEVREDIGVIHLVMEHGDIDLAKQLVQAQSNQNALLDENFRPIYWAQMLQAVRTIHEAKIVHGDLKPANFLIVAGTLKLIDFGIAKAIQTEDTTKIIRDVQVGTPNYMSPEALTTCDDDDDTQDFSDNGNGRPKYRVGRASDIWSLGCILYQMVYGKTPFAHINNIIMKLRCIQDEAFDIQFPAVQDVDVKSVLLGCLQRDPSKRLSIPALLEHQYLRRRPNSPQSKHGDLNDMPKHVWESALSNCFNRVMGKNVVSGSEKWNNVVRDLAESLPQELKKNQSQGDGGGGGGTGSKENGTGRSGYSGRRGVMMTPTTSGITGHQHTKSNGYSGHSHV